MNMSSGIMAKIISKVRNNKLLYFIFYPIILLNRSVLKLKNWQYPYYESLFSNVTEGSLVVKIKDIPGIFEIDARSDILKIILIGKGYEPHIISLVKKNCKQDKDAINIGANIGIFTILLASLINKERKVLAIEPTPLAFEYLTSNVKRNKLDGKVILFNGLCTDKKGKYNLNIIQGKEEYSSIGESFHQSRIKEKIDNIEVEGDTINNLVTSHNLNPGTIVIDVEGAEMKVLNGAKEVIEQFAPVIILEIHSENLIKQGSSSKEVIDFLLKLGYSICDITGNKLTHPFTGNVIATPGI
jgi:FkbM family methyltransferase